MEAVNEMIDEAHQPSIEFIPAPIVVVDSEGYLKYGNVFSQDLLASSKKSMIGKNLFEIIRSEESLRTLVKKAESSNSVITSYDIEIIDANLNSFKSDITIYPSVASGLFNVMFWVKSLSENIIEKKSDNEKSKSFGQIGRALAHEVKNPLAGIIGAAQLLMLDASNEQKPLAKLIIDETDRVHRLIDRVESLGIDNAVELEPINIHSIIDRVAQLAENGFASELHISRQYDVSLPLIMGERDRLTQVFLNLAKNAAEAANEKGAKGQVIFATSYRHSRKLRNNEIENPHLPIEVSITDNGFGVPDDLRNVIFDPFVTTKSEGNGLGLALVRKMVTALGGTVDFESQPGRTCFRVRLQQALDVE